MKVIISILKFFITLTLIGVLVYTFRDYRDYIPFLAAAPCTEPIPYTLGNFDERFELSKEDFLSAVYEAEKIWEEPYGKDLFTYTPEVSSKPGLAERVLKINLVYDYRQEATSKLASIGIDVKDTRTSYESLKSQFEFKKAEYEKQKNIFNSRVEAFNTRTKTYEKNVAYWNAKGGAPEEEFNKLEKERLALAKEARVLDGLQTRVNGLVGEVNALVVALNRQARTLNISADKFNAINEDRGETFEEGVYETDGFKRAINIYEFSSQEKLIRVLAHELGHALNLDHVADPTSIMYEYNQGNSMVLSADDMAELRLKCTAKKN